MSIVRERGSVQTEVTCLCEEGERAQAFHKGCSETAAALLQQIVLSLKKQSAQVTVQPVTQVNAVPQLLSS